MNSRAEIIENTKRTVGWAYSDMKWLSEGESARLEELRKARLKILSRSVCSCFSGNKLNYGTLSPGCICCGSGRWSCIFFVNACPAKCFFCSQSEEESKLKQAPKVETALHFELPGDYIGYLKLFGFTGVGFSGGDPVVNIDGLLQFIRAIKREFGERMYTWIYTSGLLINESKLDKLRTAGLDEIRFNIAANDYNLSPLSLAVNYINTVTVEIPVVPEHRDRVLGAIPNLKKIGVKHLNLHELLVTEGNFKSFIANGYTFLHGSLPRVLESEDAALAIMEYAVQKKIGLPINYCTVEYKCRLQYAGHRRRAARLVVEDCESISEAGYIRSIHLKDTPSNLEKVVAHIRRKGVNRKLWTFDRVRNCLTVHHDILDSLGVVRDKKCFFLTYHNPFLMEKDGDEASNYLCEISSTKTIYIKRPVVYECEAMNLVEMRWYRELLVNRMDPRSFKATHNADAFSLVQIREFIQSFVEYEWIEEGFAEIF